MNLSDPGFFIECGANDGEFLSNTLALELKYNWTGLLIEASPQHFKILRDNNRKSWMANVCLSGRQPEQIEFLKHKYAFPNWRIGNGKINPGEKYDEPSPQNEVFKREDYISEGMVNCFPLYSISLAMDIKKVDFFSLDVEGHEYKILSAIPFDKIYIKVIFVEHWLAPEGKDAIKKLLLENGYKLFYEDESDFIFIKN